MNGHISQATKIDKNKCPTECMFEYFNCGLLLLPTTLLSHASYRMCDGVGCSRQQYSAPNNPHEGFFELEQASHSRI